MNTLASVQFPDSATTGSDRPYRTDIDGLRAIAVVAVLAFHFGVGALTGGFIGVDVFFVISGYLMAEILGRKQQLDLRGLLDFANRRFWRLFPALFVAIAVASVIAAFLYLPDHYRDVVRSSASSIAYLSNIVIWMDFGNYFSSGAELVPVLHTWSLAVEVQFYLVFALAYCLAPRYRKVVLLVLFVVSFAIAWYGVLNYRSASFYLMPTRFWEFMLGAAVVFLPTVKLQWLRTALAATGVAIIVYCALTYTRFTLFPGPGAILPCIATVFVLWAGKNATAGIMHAALSAPPVRFIGLISYSLYIWHWPVIVFGHYYLLRPFTFAESAGALILTFVLSVLSWRFLEMPFRRVPQRRGLASLAWFGGVSAALIVAITLLPSLLPVPAARIAEAEATLSAKVFPPTECITGRGYQEPKPECYTGAADAEVSMLLWGDSHANHFAPMVTVAAEARVRQVVQINKQACRPLRGIVPLGAYPNCRTFNEAVLQYIADTPTIDTVVLASNWKALDEEFSALEETVLAVQELDRNVIIIGRQPPAGFDVPSCLARATVFGHGEEACSGLTVDEFLAREGEVVETLGAIAARTNAVLFEPYLSFCENGQCPVTDGTQPLYRDSGHLSDTGSLVLAEPFVRLLSEAQVGSPGT